MNRKPSRFILTAITAAGLLAATMTAGWAHSGLAAIAAYVAVVASLAHAHGQPVARTVGASLLAVVAALILALRTARMLLDAALWLLQTSSEGVLITVKAMA